MDARAFAILIPRLLIRAYQGVTAGSFRRCRFYPRCSDFALEALQAHGLVKGLLMGLARILRCHPWNPGGYDPVSR